MQDQLIETVGITIDEARGSIEKSAKRRLISTKSQMHFDRPKVRAKAKRARLARRANR